MVLLVRPSFQRTLVLKERSSQSPLSLFCFDVCDCFLYQHQAQMILGPLLLVLSKSKLLVSWLFCFYVSRCFATRGDPRFRLLDLLSMWIPVFSNQPCFSVCLPCQQSTISKSMQLPFKCLDNALVLGYRIVFRVRRSWISAPEESNVPLHKYRKCLGGCSTFKGINVAHVGQLSPTTSKSRRYH